MSIQSVTVTADIAARRRASVMAALVVLVVLLALVSLGIGPVRLSPLTVIDALFGGGSDVQQVIVREIRLPRTILGCAIGAILGLSGAALQGLLRNPLASPSLFGAPQSAAFGAVLVIALGLADVRSYALPVAAIIGGVRLGIRAARRRGPQRRTADSHFGRTGDIEPRGCRDRAGDESFQQSVRGARNCILAARLAGGSQFSPCRAGAAVHRRGRDHPVPSQRNAFRALSLGEETAQSLGVDVDRLRLLVILGVALGVGGAVAVSGTIGFIGLVAPHLMRPLIGHDPARLLVPSALTGAALLLAADIAVRIIPSTSDIKVGVLTSIIGVPFFLYLIMRERRALGGGVA